MASTGAETVTEPAWSGIEVEDTTGAGDAFCAGFCYGLLRGAPLKLAARYGNVMGAACCQGLGAEITAAVWADFLNPELAKLEKEAEEGFEAGRGTGPGGLSGPAEAPAAPASAAAACA